MFDEVTKSVRVLSAAGVEKANSGHPGMPLGAADIGVALFKNGLKISNENPDWINRDRFVLSAGHGSMLLYSLLHFNGYNISIEDIKNFRQLGSITAGHPEKNNELGIDITTGPLGQGFATGVGLALAESYLSSIFGNEIIDHYVFGIVSDGDLMEGISFEAAELASVWELGKIIYFFDDNNISIDGKVEKVSKTNQKLKFESLGWHVQEIDGHNESEINLSIKQAKDELKKPSLIIAKTTIGKYSPNKQNTSGVHGSPLGTDEMNLFLKNISWEGDPFLHNKNVYSYFEEKREQDNKDYLDWQATLKKKIEENNQFKELWTQFLSGEIKISDLENENSAATRVAGGKVLKNIGENNKFILGGSADLAASTKQIISENYFNANNKSGQSIEFGIREHAMSAIVNGITLHSNLYGYGSTFLVFSDYMRPSIRLASLMKLDSTFIFTHDSIYLGEDGPTHQPVEHLMSLRLIPGLDVIRPSNSKEIENSYRLVFSNDSKTSLLVLTRQDLDYLDYQIDFETFTLGVYEVANGNDFSIVASGSEVNLAFEIQKLLKDYSIQIISAPIVNRINDVVLKKLNLNKKIFTLELGKSIGWSSYIGNVTKSYSIENFGSSAPQDDLKEHFQFSAQFIAEDIKNILN